MGVIKSGAAVLIMLCCLVGIAYFKGYKAGAPWLMRLIGRIDLIDPDYYGPDYEMLPNGKFRYVGDDEESDDEDDLPSKY